MIKIIKWHADERVDLPDANEFGGEITLTENTRIFREMFLPTGRSGGAAATECRTLTGFGIPTAVPAATVVLNRGTGIFKILRDGDLKLGMLIGDAGQASQTIDLVGLGADTYAIYVRAVYTDTDKENRVHWDDSGSAEAVLFVDTRKELIWEWTYRSTSAAAPAGGDWAKVWELTWDGAAVTAKTDYRHSYFEGDLKTGAGVYLKQEWGTGNDRNADRAAYGVTDFHQWIQAMRQKIDDIQGAYYDWWEAPLIDLSIMDNEHWGGVKWGRHKNVTIGDTTRWWRWQAEHLVPNFQQASLRALDLNTAGCAVLVDDTGANRVTALTLVTRGLPTGDQSMQNNEVVRHAFGFATADYEDRITRLGATQYKREFKRQGDAPGSYDVLINAGSTWSTTYRGLWLPVGAGLHYAQRTVEMVVPLTNMMRDAASSWKLDCFAGADVVNNTLFFGTPDADDELYATIHDFPEYATLDAIHVYWRQAGDGGVRQMRMYAGRTTHDMKTAKNQAGEIHGRSSLKLGPPLDYVEYVWAAGQTYRVSVFTCDRNNTNLRRGEDEIHIGLYSGANAVAYYVFAIMLQFSYTEACPFPNA